MAAATFDIDKFNMLFDDDWLCIESLSKSNISVGGGGSTTIINNGVNSEELRELIEHTTDLELFIKNMLVWETLDSQGNIIAHP